MFFWKSCYFCDPVDVGNLISGSSSFSKSSLNIWFTVHVLLKPGLENFKHYFASVWDECSCTVVWAFFGIAFLWDWNKNNFSSPVATVSAWHWNKWQWGNIPHPRSGAAAALSWSRCEEIPHIQSQRNPSKKVGTGAAVRRCPRPKGKGEAPARW